jgi:hypothetical protein
MRYTGLELVGARALERRAAFVYLSLRFGLARPYRADN